MEIDYLISRFKKVENYLRKNPGLKKIIGWYQFIRFPQKILMA